jgi:hypothetical protein
VLQQLVEEGWWQVDWVGHAIGIQTLQNVWFELMVATDGRGLRIFDLT